MGRHSKAAKLVGGVRGGRALLDDDERRRAIEAGERDIDDGVGFLRYGSARHGVDGRVRRRVQGPFQGRDRPRPGDERHAGTGNPRRAPRRDTRHRQTGEGRGRRARPRGTRVRDGAPNPPHRPRAAGHRNGPKPSIMQTKRRKPPHYKSGTKKQAISMCQTARSHHPSFRLCGPVVSACRRTAPGRSRRRTRGSQPDARPSATASGRSSPE